MSEPATQEERAVRAAFRRWCERTHVRFAPYMGSVDDTYREWRKQYPADVEAAIAAISRQSKEQP